MLNKIKQFYEGVGELIASVNYNYLPAGVKIPAVDPSRPEWTPLSVK